MKEEQGVCGKVRYLNEIYEKIPRMYQPLKEVRSEIDQTQSSLTRDSCKQGGLWV